MRNLNHNFPQTHSLEFIIMKVLILIITIVIGSNSLNAQALFNLKYSFSKPRVESELKSVQLFDYTGDGEVETVVVFNNNSTWTISIFNLDGLLIDSFEGLKNHGRRYDKESIITAKLFNYDDKLYIAIGFLYGSYYQLSTFYNFETYLGVYEVISNELQLISSQSTTYRLGDGNQLHDSSLSVFKQKGKLWINFGVYFNITQTDINEYYSYTRKSFISIFQFTNELLLINKYDNCYKAMQNSNVALGLYEFYNNRNYYDDDSWLYLIEYSDSNATLNEVYRAKVPIQLITSDHTNDSPGTIIYRLIRGIFEFQCFSSDLSRLKWTNTNTFLENKSYGIITASSAIKINDLDKYIIYFNKDKMEIRDITNGEVVHYQTANIVPIQILRDDNKNTYFLSKIDNLYGMFELELNEFFTTSVNQENYERPLSFSLSQNFPNPFNPSTKIRFELPFSGHILLKIFNSRGQLVKTLIERNLETGSHDISIGLGDLNSGIYFYQLISNGRIIKTKKMLFLK